VQRICSQFGVVLLALLLLGAMSGTAAAQAPRNSGASAILLSASVGEAVTVTLSANAVHFNLTPGTATNPGDTGITVTTSWNSKPGRDLNVYAYFSSATAALSNGTANIPSSAFSISTNGGAYLPVTNTVIFGGAGAGLQVGLPTKIMGLNKRGTRVDTMLFNLNISALTLPGGTYTGVLTVRAQAI
jgi:hypothetical protein